MRLPLAVSVRGDSGHRVPCRSSELRPPGRAAAGPAGDARLGPAELPAWSGSRVQVARRYRNLIDAQSGGNSINQALLRNPINTASRGARGPSHGDARPPAAPRPRRCLGSLRPGKALGAARTRGCRAPPRSPLADLLQAPTNTLLPQPRLPRAWRVRAPPPSCALSRRSPPGPAGFGGRFGHLALLLLTPVICCFFTSEL